MKTKIMIVDDHALVRTGINLMLSGESGFCVVGECDSGEEALLKAADIAPDVVLMDIRMPGMGGLEATRRLLRLNPGLRVIILTACDVEPYPTRLLRAGVVGYLTKGVSADVLARAIRSVMQGRRFLDDRVAHSLALASCDQVPGILLDSLSERELQVMLMVANCASVATIAKRLNLSPKTVNTYRYRIFEKLQVESDVELALLAVRHGMIDIDKSA